MQCFLSELREQFTNSCCLKIPPSYSYVKREVRSSYALLFVHCFTSHSRISRSRVETSLASDEVTQILTYKCSVPQAVAMKVVYRANACRDADPPFL